ncbi:MAG TPA: RNA methyltransferase [Anaerolineales bacterium]|nr:RNA methyltransferase [Anaerolineales bacterium]
MTRSRRSAGRKPTPAALHREVILGRNPVLEVLRAGRRKVWRVRLAEGARPTGPLAEILTLAESRGIPVERVTREALEAESGKSHGIAADADRFSYCTLDDILDEARRRATAPFVLLLDLLQDPQNVGTLLRTADAVGISGVVVPLGRAVGVTPAVVSASAGASEHLWIAAENLAVAIGRLQEEGVRVIGLEAGPESVPIEDVPLGGPLALVVGSEGGGLRRLVRERCDVLCLLPMRGRVASLNAAVAGSIALYLAGASRPPVGSDLG